MRVRRHGDATHLHQTACWRSDIQGLVEHSVWEGALYPPQSVQLLRDGPFPGIYEPVGLDLETTHAILEASGRYFEWKPDKHARVR